jgi:hypothetical protein
MFSLNRNPKLVAQNFGDKVLDFAEKSRKC